MNNLEKGKAYWHPDIINGAVWAEPIIWADTEDDNRIRSTVGIFRTEEEARKRGEEILEKAKQTLGGK